MDVFLASLLASIVSFALGLHAERHRWLRSADDWTTSVKVGDERYDVLSVSGWDYRPRHTSDPDLEVHKVSSSLPQHLFEEDAGPFPFGLDDYVHEQAKEMERDFFHGSDTR